MEKFADDSGFLQRRRQTQETAKASLANFIKETTKIEVDPKVQRVELYGAG